MPVHVPVPVEASLLTPTPKPYVPQRPLFADDLERLAREAMAGIDACNADKAAIKRQSEETVNRGKEAG